MVPAVACLTPEQCLEAVEEFCRAITKDRIPWHFALHLELEKKGEPDWNPHTHIIFRDRHIQTGKRFLYTSAGPKRSRCPHGQGRDGAWAPSMASSILVGRRTIVPFFCRFWLKVGGA